jgi:membrane-associated phospholipid phosphatase
MKLFFTQHKWFFLPYLAIMAVAGYFLVNFSKAEVHIWSNQHYSEFFDIFFQYLTNLGDGMVLPLLLVIMLMIRFRDSILLVVVFLLSGLLVQLLKRLVFHEAARPTKYFANGYPLHLVQGVEQLSSNSFPSGHSASAFGFFLCFALVTKQNWLKLVLLVLACLVAYSRIYLSQHFLIDCMAGSLIGVITTIFTYPKVYSYKQSWMEDSLVTLYQRKKNRGQETKI